MKGGGVGPDSSSQPSLMKNYNAKECTDTVDVIHIYYFVDRHTCKQNRLSMNILIH